jgi:RHS repeat-associated protein
VLEERLYYCQSWRADVVAVVDSSGTLVEGARYSAYGVPFGVPAGDTNSDLAFDSTDSTNITGWSPPASYDVRYDVNLDGAITSADASAAATVTLGRGVLSSAAIDNRRGYAAYEFWPQPAATLWSVRHRVLHSDLGRWTRRDPGGVARGVNLYAYVKAMVLVALDPLGLQECTAVAAPPGVFFFVLACTCARVIADCDTRGREACLKCCNHAPAPCRSRCWSACYDNPDWYMLTPDYLPDVPDPPAEFLPRAPLRDFYPYLDHPIGPNCTWRWEYNPFDGSGRIELRCRWN